MSSALPRFLHRQGSDIRPFLPLYQRIYDRSEELAPVEFVQDVPVWIGPRQVRFWLYTSLPAEDAPAIYFVHCPEFYDRPGLYTGDWDEHQRFVLLSRAAILACQRMAFAPHVFHCNDWQTALIPLYLKALYSWDRLFRDTKSILTIHNIGYQGTVSSDYLNDLGLSDHSRLLHQVDLGQGRINFLKTGVLYADALTTVSPTYAREIQRAELGMGLQDLLSQRSASLFGILNGVDYADWNPEIDPLIPHRYSSQDFAGKSRNKRHLLGELGLIDSAEAPLLGIISRLTAQKGLDLVLQSIRFFLRRRELRLAVLGSGESGLEGAFARLQHEFPGRVCFYNGFNNNLAHLIEAACDIFLMPSRFEPCGLNQMYSLRYGSVPVVRKTGGLADTVQHFDASTGVGTGFVFEHYNAEGFAWALDLALRTFETPQVWQRLMFNGMSKDFSWERQGALYLELYRQLCGFENE